MYVTRLARSAVVLATVAGTLSASRSPLLAQGGAGQSPTIIESAFRSDTSPPLRDIPVSRPAQVRTPNPMRLDANRLALRLAPAAVDTALQSGPGPTPRVSVVQSFDGLVQTGWIPPDPTGAAGDSQYVQAANTHFAVFEKRTGERIFGPRPLNTLWRGFGTACESRNDGDPIIQYDKLAGRWIITQFQIGGRFDDAGYYSQCVAVSESGDALGRYYRYEFRYPDFNDYPKLGVWPDAYYVSFNIFGEYSQKGTLACAYERARMLGGQAARQVCFQLSSAFMSLLPSDLDGTRLPPRGLPNIFLGLGHNSRSVNYWKFRVDWADPQRSTFGRGAYLEPNGRVAVQSFVDACHREMSCVSQGGSQQKLDAIGERLMYRLAYRQLGDAGVLVTNHSVKTPAAAAGIRWYMFATAGDSLGLVQQGTFSPDRNSRWMGSIAADRMGNIAIGYSVAGDSMAPQVRITGRGAGDVLGLLGADTASFLRLASGGSQADGDRWGDYSHMSMDPVDDCTFWFVAPYHSPERRGGWILRTAAFRFDDCVPQGTGTTPSQTTGGTVGSPLDCDSTANQGDVWGGDGVRLVPTRQGFRMDLPCAHAFADTKLPSHGRFTIPGEFVAEQGGALREDESEPRRRVSFQGRIADDEMTLDLWADTERILGPLLLRRGCSPRITKCR
jgi:hypothetical protein